MTKRRWVLACVLAMTSPLWARPGTVSTRDGQKFEGEITEKADEVIVNIRGVDTVITRDNLAGIVYGEGFDTEFAQRLSRLAETDVAGRVALARWAFDQHRYDKAREALEQALAIDPNDLDAVNMMNLVRSQIRMEQKPRVEIPPATGPSPAVATAMPGLSSEQINDIRLKELQETDANAIIRFENDVKRRYAEFSRRNLGEFARLRSVDAALLILTSGTPEMARDLRMTNDPSSIAEFRRTVMPIVLNSCATANCHGPTGNGPGNVKFFSPAAADGEAYFNFLLLNRLARAEGGNGNTFFGGGGSVRRMVERGQGDRSLLVNYMLPAALTDLPHPQAAGYDGAARNLNDPKIRTIVRWMNESLRRPTPEYDLLTPQGRPTTAPATQP